MGIKLTKSENWTLGQGLLVTKSENWVEGQGLSVRSTAPANVPFPEGSITINGTTISWPGLFDVTNLAAGTVMGDLTNGEFNGFGGFIAPVVNLLDGPGTLSWKFASGQSTSVTLDPWMGGGFISGFSLVSDPAFPPVWGELTGSWTGYITHNGGAFIAPQLGGAPVTLPLIIIPFAGQDTIPSASITTPMGTFSWDPVNIGDGGATLSGVRGEIERLYYRELSIANAIVSGSVITVSGVMYSPAANPDSMVYEARPTTLKLVNADKEEIIDMIQPGDPPRELSVTAPWNPGVGRIFLEINNPTGGGSFFDTARFVIKLFTAPDQPTSPTGIARHTAAALGWSTPTFDGDSPITSYNIYNADGDVLVHTTLVGEFVSATGGQEWGQDPIYTYKYTVEGLTDGTQYTFYIKAVNAAGESAASTSIVVTPTLTAPDAPNASRGAVGDGFVTLNFSQPGYTGGSSILNFKVYDSSNTLIATPGPNDTSFTVTGLTNGVKHTFFVTVTNAIGESAPATVSGSPTAS